MVWINSEDESAFENLVRVESLYDHHKFFVPEMDRNM